MRGVKLSEHIRYLHCDGDNQAGGHGVLIFDNPNGSKVVVDVETKDEFKSQFTALKALESAFYSRA